MNYELRNLKKNFKDFSRNNIAIFTITVINFFLKNSTCT